MLNSLFKLFECKCVLEVCVHIHPIMICFFLNPYFKILFLKSGCSESPVSMTLFCTGPSHKSWLTGPSYLSSAPWVSWELSVSGAGKTRCLRLSDCVVLLLNVIMNKAVIPTSDLLKTQRINVTFALKWMHRSPIFIKTLKNNINLCKMGIRWPQ